MNLVKFTDPVKGEIYINQEYLDEAVAISDSEFGEQPTTKIQLTPTLAYEVKEPIDDVIAMITSDDCDDDEELEEDDFELERQTEADLA